MSSKKKGGNGFFKFCLHKQREDQGLSGLSPQELVELCSPLWCSMSVMERSRFTRECREEDGGGPVKGGYDSYGRPLAQLANRSRQEGLELENMKMDIKSRVDRALMNQQLEDEVFYLLHTNVFCMTAEGGVVPAELSLARVSLRQGVEEVYQVFIEPGTLPKGYRADCTENSEATHKIPLDLALFNGNYQQILEDMLEFLLGHPDCMELPPLYSLPKFKKQNVMVLGWLLDRVQCDLVEEVNFKLYSLPILLYELAREENRSTATSLSMSSLSGSDTRVPTISIAERQLDSDRFIYTPGLSCTWHEEIETSHCTSATVMRWSFMMFSLTCHLYGLELLPGKHKPVTEKLEKSIRGSVASTMSVCSGYTGVSSELGRDATKEIHTHREKREHPLAAWQKASRRLLASPLKEWEKFGYQEQASTDLSSEKGDK